MATQPVMRVEKDYFETKDDVLRDIMATGNWPTTYVSPPSPELPLHWHDGEVIGYVMSGQTYLLDANGKRHDLTAGDRLILPAGAVHAEGEVLDTVTYIVTTERCAPLMDVLRLLDPAAYPEPTALEIDPALFALAANQG